MKSKDICYELPKDIVVKDNTSTVYNYHISAILDNINEIHDVDENINDDSDMAISV